MPSLRAAIDAKCRSCIYDPACGNGKWREQVAACSSSNCPLHSVRPRSAAKSHRGATQCSSNGPDHAPADNQAMIEQEIGQIGGATVVER